MPIDKKYDQRFGVPYAPGINSPDDYQNVTPSDTADLNFRCRVVWCGTGGNIYFLSGDDKTICFMKNVPAAQWVQLRTNRIMFTNTTASDILAGA